MAPRVQLPQSYKISENGIISDQYYFFFRQLFASLPPGGSGYVVDGSATSYGTMTLFQGVDADKPAPQTGYIYFALDTEKIYIVIAGAWMLMNPALIGDVTKPAGSNILTIANVNSTPGTYGSPTTIPVTTINTKGQVTSIYTVPLVAPAPVAAGSTGQIQFNNGGILAANPNLVFSQINNTLYVTNGVIPIGGVFTINSNTIDSFLYSDASRNVKSTASATDGQLLIGSTGLVPVAATLTAGFAIDITNAAGSITIAVNHNALAPSYDEITAFAGQTVFTTTVNTLANASGHTYLQIFVNGVLQREGASKAYTVTGATQITFNTGLAVNDEVDFYSFT